MYSVVYISTCGVVGKEYAVGISDMPVVRKSE